MPYKSRKKSTRKKIFSGFVYCAVNGLIVPPHYSKYPVTNTTGAQMVSKFLTDLDAKELPNGHWQLTEPLEYLSSYLRKKIIVPAGFITNFMSVPRWPFIYAWLGDKYRRAGALHDFLYQARLVSRWAADSELCDAMVSLGASDTEIIACWLAVRIAGGSRYGKND